VLRQQLPGLVFVDVHIGLSRHHAGAPASGRFVWGMKYQGQRSNASTAQRLQPCHFRSFMGV
jgi:hypothetical protein